MSLPSWTPTEEGTSYTMTPILQPLVPFRDRVTVLSGFGNANANVQQGDAGGDHTRAQAVFLTGTRPHKTEGPDIHNGVSMDQIAAQTLGAETQLPSLELALEANDLVGGCDSGYACAYTATIAWKNAIASARVSIGKISDTVR